MQLEELECLRVVARRQLDLGAPVAQDPDQRPEHEHVRRRGHVDPDPHRSLSLRTVETDDTEEESMSETSVEIRTGQVVWHDLMTTDVEAARRFYGTLLGWDFNVWKPGEFDYPMIHIGDSDHGGIGRQDPGIGVPPHWRSYVRVDDVDAAAARCEQRPAGRSSSRRPTFPRSAGSR